MDGILILAHGSRRQETDRILDSLTTKVQEKMGTQLIFPAYLQFSEQNLEVGIEHLSSQGATKIKVIPMFIFDGIHVTQDIPQELERLQAKYPHVELKLGGHLGDDERIAEIIVDRIKDLA